MRRQLLTPDRLVAVSERAWRAKWSSELERVWSSGLAGNRDPRASIRAPRAQRRTHVSTDGSSQRTVSSPGAQGQDRTVSAPAPLRQPTVSTGQPPARLPERDEVFATREFDDGESQAIRSFMPAHAGHRKVVIADKREEPRRLEIPELEIEDEIGAGGMGKVFRARQMSLDRHVALKRLTPNDNLPDAVSHFESEACITAVLDHPNIVPVHDMGQDADGSVFYSMKLIEGTPWDDLLYKRAPGSVAAPEGDDRDLRAHLEILLEVANAVAFAHSKGIIHRDIKPQNVMVGDYGEVLLVDWGLAVSLRPIEHPARIFDLSQVLVTCGTPAYMPPEISTGQREWIGTWTDVYMLGAVLFEVLYSLPPHEESTAIDALKVASRNEWRFPTEISPELEPYHEVLKPVVIRALATHPGQRFADAGEFRDAVKEALTHLDAAELAGEAIQMIRRVELEHASAQRARQGSATAVTPTTDEKDRYRMLARAIPLLEQALCDWPENAGARQHLVEAHLLHALIALESGDLSLARHHLEEIDRLPCGIVCSPEQRLRVQKLAKRLDNQVGRRERRARRMLTLQLSAAFLVLALLVGAAAAALLIRGARDQARRERNHLSQLLIATAGDGIQSELQSLLQPVQGSLRAAADWAEAGRLDSDDPQELTSFFMPLIDGFPVISSVIRADAEGREYILFRTENGWRTRTTAPGELEQFQELAPDGTVLKTWTEDLDYDSKTRPWYKGARELEQRAKNEIAARDAIAWTEPYTFYTTREVGITASMTAKSPTGRDFVIGMDLSLADLSAFTQSMPESEHGKVFVMTEDDRVLGLPRSERFADAAARKEALLQPVTEIGDPVAGGALRQWEARDRAPETPFRFVQDGPVWWSGFRSFDLGLDSRMWIGVVLPEADFDVPAE